MMGIRLNLVFIFWILMTFSLSAAEPPTIHQAARRGNLEIVKSLLQKDPSLATAKDKRQLTPLHYAVFGGHTEVVLFLIEKKADVNAGDSTGNTPFMWAVARNKEAIAELLIQKGANVNQKTNTGGIPLLHAAKFGKEGIFRLLVKNGAKVNCKNSYDVTPLHMAAAAGSLEKVKALVEAGADLNVVCSNGKTPLHFAKEHLSEINISTADQKHTRHGHGDRNNPQHKEIINLLVSKGAKDLPVKFPVVKGEFLGQKKPGLKPELFAYGLLVSPFSPHGKLTFSPDGKQIYWSHNAAPIQSRWVMTMKTDGTWTPPVPSPLSADYLENGLCFANGGKRVYFHSRRSTPEGGKLKDPDIWYRDITDKGWGKAVNAGPVINSSAEEMAPTVSANGNIYFVREGDSSDLGSNIFCSRLVNGKYTKPEPLGGGVNADAYDLDPMISPDEKFIVFVSTRRGGYNPALNLYVSFKGPDGQWGEAVCFNKAIKMQRAWWSDFTPDGRYFLFCGETENEMGAYYWVDAKIFDTLKPGVEAK